LATALVLALTIAWPVGTYALTWHVPLDAPSIQAGIDSASAGDTVEVACGTYYEHGITMKSGVCLRSETGLPECVTIDAQGLGRAFLCTGLGATTTVEGFTVSGGYASGYDGGGGMYCDNSSFTIRDCVFSGNSSDLLGGGVHCFLSPMTFIRCAFRDNTSGNSGGGVSCHTDSHCSFTECEIDGNTALYGAGFYTMHVSITLTDCTISGNSASMEGGGLYCHGNEFSEDALPTLTNCTLSGNESGSYGGGMFLESYYAETANISNTIIAFSIQGNAVACDDSASAVLTCCDVYGNELGDWAECIAGQNGINGNFSTDPLFWDAEGGDFSLRPCSPCVDAPGCGLVGAHGPAAGFTTIHVPADAPTIQAGIDLACVGDTVVVACGTYYEHDIEMTPGICLRSETGEYDCVTIDADSLGRVLICEDGAGPTTIRGITFTGGYAHDAGGVGIGNITDQVEVTNCFFHANVCSSGIGGGLFLWQCPEVSLTDCRFENNATAPYGWGGGLASWSGNPVMTRCDFVANESSSGGGVYTSYETLVMTDCFVADNISQSGGGVVCHNNLSGDNVIEGTIFANNTATYAPSGGGAIESYSSDLSITNCTFYGNSSPDSTTGAAIDLYQSDIDMDNSIIAFSPSGQPISCESFSYAWLECCDVYGNTDGDWVGCIFHQAGVSGNFSADPLFCDPGAGDYHVSFYSPCAGSPTCGRVGALGPGCAGPNVWIVPIDAPTIQAGIDSAASGDTVVVSCGTYYEHDIAMASGVHLRSETGLPDCVTIDAQEMGRVFVCEWLDPEATITGFTITGGLPAETETARWGGGIHSHYSLLSVRHCNITGNTAIAKTGALGAGGGVCCSFLGPEFSDCTIYNNSALGVPGHDGIGGGMYCYASSPTLTNCTFYGNFGEDNGGAIACHTSSSSPTLNNTILAFSTSGEAVYCGTGASVTLACCDVYGNAGGDYVDCLAGQNGINGNFSADPIFCNPGIEDFRVRFCSPCLDAPGCGLVGAHGLGIWTRTWRIPLHAPTIQAGIDSAACGDTVLVYDGTYSGPGNRDIDFHGKAIVVRATNPGDYTSIIDCGGSRSEYHRAFHFHSGEDSTSVLQGFMIINGLVDGYGGAVLCDSASSPFIHNMVLSGNSADHGGGIACRDHSSPRLGAIQFSNNSTGSGGYGGGLHCANGSAPSVLDLSFMDNSADFGGGMCCIDGGCDAFLNRVLFARNSAGRGGAIYCVGSSPIVTETTLYGNSAEYGSGFASDLSGSHVVAERTIISFGSGGEAVYCDDPGSSSTLSCCDVYGNAGGDWVGCIAGQDGTNGNISADPLFCGVFEDDFSISESSPCWYLNSPPGCEVIGAFGEGCQYSSVERAELKVPATFQLGPAVPNPFNPITEISYGIPAASGPSKVTLRVFNALGQRVKTLVDDEQAAGYYAVTWDGRDHNGVTVASGVYFYRIEWSGKVETKRMVLLK
jgi:predicted outer membrane repeat protein